MSFQPGAEELDQKILECLKAHPDLNTVVAALESTPVYSIHIANYLSSCEELMCFKPYVFALNPKCTANYKKIFYRFRQIRFDRCLCHG